MDDNTINVVDYVPEEATPGQLIALVNMLADEVNKWRTLTSRYEAELAEKKAAYKIELAKAKVLFQGHGTATIINALAETSEYALRANEAMTKAESNYLIANGRYDGVLAQYQAVKQSLNLKVEELRTFRG